MLLNLSHPLGANTPFYDELPKPRLDRLYDLAKGDVCNSFYLTTSNHAGTHVDAPNHFKPNGRRISEYALEELVFTRPVLVTMAPLTELLIRKEDLGAVESARRDCDILLLRSGFGHCRTADPRRYVERGPGFSRASAEYLLAALPELRALAVDFISISSLQHEHEGAEAHRVFLGCAGYSERAVLLVEDAFFPESLDTPSRVRIVPWFVEGVDSAPCTLIAELRAQQPSTTRLKSTSRVPERTITGPRFTSMEVGAILSCR